MINPLKAKLKKWPSLLLRPSLYCHATGVMRQRTRGGEIWLSTIDFERSWLEFSCWSSHHGCLNPKQTLLAVYHLHGKMVSKIRTGKFCPELVQIEGKTWNWNKRWLWRNGTRISVPKNRSTLLYPPLLAEIFRLIDRNICVPYLFLLKQIFSAIMIFSSTFSRQQHFFKVLTSLKRGENWIWRKELFKFWMCFQKIIFFSN